MARMLPCGGGGGGGKRRGVGVEVVLAEVGLISSLFAHQYAR